MKKIVGILCAAAMFTASVFAADVAVVTRFEGDLFKYQKDSKVELLRLEDGAEYWYADFAVATWGEQAGATVVWSSGNGFENPLAKGRMMMYFKPFEGLELKLGFIETSLHVEHIDWWRTTAYQRVSGYGYTAVYMNGPFGIELFMNPGAGFWLTDAVKGANFWTKLWFGTDVGTFGATLNFGAEFKTFTALIGWDKSFGATSVWADAAFGIDTEADDAITGITVAFDVSGDVDAFHHESFVEVALGAPKAMEADGYVPGVTFWGRYAFALDAVTAYIKIVDNDVLAPAKDGGKLSVMVQPGVTGNFGGMAWDVGLKIDVVNEDPTISIPFSTQINF